MKKYRYVEFYKEYFDNFYSTLPLKVQKKFIWTFQLIEIVELIPDKYLKHIQDGIYEVRVKHSSNIYRAFAFFDREKLIIVMNGFIKKSPKTPKSEIERAIKLRAEYEKEKE